MKLKLLAAATVLGLSALGGTAQAGGIDVHIGLGHPGVVYYDSAPRYYYSPRPVYRYYDRRPVVRHYYHPREYRRAYRHRHDWHGHRGHDRHYRHDRRDHHRRHRYRD
ncbi:hypothetical protein [Panacagrimonas sp.]|uniref:hypothetical protein n=1 Tax=Panacagrimonas sp. TaxID=2480088 RepID=UPI003B52E9A4